MQIILRLGATSLLVLTNLACANEADIEGRWLSGDESGWIEIRLVDGLPKGFAAGATQAEPTPRLDTLNPDPTLRSRRLLGITILDGFEYVGENVWKGGWVYDPNSGKTYRCSMTLVDHNTLKVRGFVGVSLFGRSDTWTRDDP